MVLPGIVTRRLRLNRCVPPDGILGWSQGPDDPADKTGMTYHLRRGHEHVTWEIGPGRARAGHELTFSTPQGPLVFEYFDRRDEALRRWRDLSRLLEHQGWQPQADS